MLWIDTFAVEVEVCVLSLREIVIIDIFVEHVIGSIDAIENGVGLIVTAKQCVVG